MAIIGLVITLVFEKRKSQQAIELGNQLKEDMGFIEVEDPTRVYLRPLHSEGDSHWEYRIYLPPGHGMDFESRWVTTQIQNIDRLKEAHRQGSLS